MTATRPAFAVIGLGRFGTSIVNQLSQTHAQILAVDRDPARVEAVADQVDQAVVADASAEESLRRLALPHFDAVVFAMGEDFESSVMGTMIAKELGCPRVVVKALDPRQATILTRIGADQVVLPEVEMGAKLARKLVNPNVIDDLAQIDDITITERHPDARWLGKTLAEADIRRTANLEVIALIRGGQTEIPVKATTRLEATDILLTVANR